MAVFQINDVHQVMQVLANQATGRSDIAVVDHASFIDAGTKTLATGTDNVLGAIARTIRDVFVVGIPYTGKFSLVNASEEKFNDRHANIHFYTKYNEAEGGFNTNLFTNIADGYDNETNGGASAPSQWVQDLPMVVERFFLNEAAWQKRMTTPIAQLQNAFNDEGTFLAFMNGYALNVQNEINTYIEAHNRALVADRIAGIYLQVQNGNLGAECAVNMTKYFNDMEGTSYTTDEILHEHAARFLELFTSKLQIDSERLEEYSAQYHDPMKITENGVVDYYVLSHTPKENQRAFINREILALAKAVVAPEIFGPQFIPEVQGEKVGYWQSNKEGSRYAIKCKPALPEGAVSSKVELDCVLGLVFDERAMYSHNQFTGMYSTPVEAAKLYKNDIWHFKFGSYTDYLSNSIMYYMADEPSAATTDGLSSATADKISEDDHENE